MYEWQLQIQLRQAEGHDTLSVSLSVPIFTANELIQLRKPHTDRLELGRGEASVIPAAFDLRFDSFQLVKVSLGHDEMLPTR